MKSKNDKIALLVLTVILAISAFSVITTPVGAQPVEVWNVTWGGTDADRVRAIATTEDSVYLAGACVFGYSNVSGGEGAFLNKYDGDGNLIWNVTCGRDGWGWATATGDNAVYLAGYTSHGACLNKYDSTDGNLIWNITWSGTGDALGYATAVAGDSVYLAGPDLSTDGDFCNTFLNKYNGTDGRLIWNITWGKTGSSWNEGQAIATIGDSVYLAGTTSYGSPKSHNFSVDTFLVKFSEPTPTPSENVTGECKTLWYFDEESLKCQQKEFCGLYMYQGLRTFETEEECKAALEKYLREKKEETPTPSPTPTPTPPGFEAGFAIAGLLTVAYLVLRRRRN